MATITETKNQLSALLDQVRQGETILIMDRNRPVARLVPVMGEEASDREGKLVRLERSGALRRGRSRPSSEVLNKPPPKPVRGGDILKALLEERESGR